MNNTTLTIPNICFNVSGSIQCRGPSPRRGLPNEIQELIDLDQTLKPVFSTMSFVLLSIAVIGNLSIIVTIIKDPKIHGMAHVFLLNIAIADVLYALVGIISEALPFVLTAKKLRSQSIKCNLTRPLLTGRFVCYGVAVFSLAILSIERWYAICQPFAAARNTSYKKRIKFAVLLVIWALSVGISSPLTLCTYSHAKEHAIVLAVSYLALPFTIIMTANGRIILSIKKAGVFAVSRKIGQETQRRRKHLLKLLFGIVISFIVLWLPYTVLYVYLAFFPPASYLGYFRGIIISRAIMVTTYLNPALNAFMYYGFCKDFRRGLASLVRKSTTRTPVSAN